MKEQTPKKLFHRGSHRIAVVGLVNCKQNSFLSYPRQVEAYPNQATSFTPIVPLVPTFGLGGQSQMEPGGNPDSLTTTSDQKAPTAQDQPGGGDIDGREFGELVQGEDADESVVQENKLPRSDQNTGFLPPWDLEIHRAFVQAVMDTGINHASPAVIIENLRRPAPAEMNPERVKSHLQKYRKNREKSMAEFRKEYDDYIQKAISLGSAGLARKLADPSAVLDILGDQQPLGGESAALLTYSIKAEESRAKVKAGSAANTTQSPRPSVRQRLKRSSDVFVEHFAGTRVELPQLTEQEKASSLGIAMNQTMALSLSLTRQIMAQRLAKRVRLVQQCDENKIPPVVESKNQSASEGGPSQMPAGRPKAERQASAGASRADQKVKDQPVYTYQQVMEGVDIAAEGLLAASGRAVEQRGRQHTAASAHPQRDDSSSMEENDVLWGRSIQPFDTNAADFQDSACSSPVPPNAVAATGPPPAPQVGVSAPDSNAAYAQVSFPQHGIHVPPMTYDQLQHLLQQQSEATEQQQASAAQNFQQRQPQQQVQQQQNVQQQYLDYFQWKQSQGG